jgi:hypothetical protein
MRWMSLASMRWPVMSMAASIIDRVMLFAVAEGAQVALLNFQQVARGLGVVHVDVARQQVKVILLGLAVVVLALPQRIVTVKTDQADGARRRRRGGVHRPRIQGPW